ncbi:hypothetical protein MRX96_020481 [Rhipicephalus microplus]
MVVGGHRQSVESGERHCVFVSARFCFVLSAAPVRGSRASISIASPDELYREAAPAVCSHLGAQRVDECHRRRLGSVVWQVRLRIRKVLSRRGSVFRDQRSVVLPTASFLAGDAPCSGKCPER